MRWPPCVWGLLLAACVAQAQPRDPLSLADAVEAAWRLTASSAESAAQMRIAQAERAVAEALWAAPPNVEVGANRDRQRATGTARETELGLAVPMWLPGQRAARAGQVDAQVQFASAATAAARLRVAGRVRELAAQFAVQQAELLTLQGQLRAFEDLARDVERRVAAGDLARADALAAQAERLAAAVALSQARQRLQTTELAWLALTGLREVPRLPTDAVGDAQEHPALRAASLRVEAARQRLKVTQASGRAPPLLLLQGRQEVAPGEPVSRGLGVAVRIPLATADRWEPLLAAALAELAQAEASERELQQQLRAEIDTARLAREAASQQLADDSERARLLRERASLIERSFQVGETALPDMLRALTAATQAQVSVARAQATLAQATARLQQAQGVMP